jgi:serine/threonine protein kinase
VTAGPGTVLGGRYELVKPLAAGGMGTVWLGRHLELETEVAIKLVEGPLARRPDLLERFRREARAAAQLKTPHVVQILDYGTDDGTPYIAMELLEGEDLEALLAREKTLSPARVLEILRPLCRALEMAHAAGIVHRDLKPANVFVARVAGDEVIKLVDFGIAKELHRGGEHTTGATVVGSPLFMSPEQIDEKSAVDARTDVWALGVMAHLMLSGTTPFVATTIASILYKIVHEPLELPSVHAPSLAPFDAFFSRALARPAAERYATVTELLAGFEAAVAHVDVPSVALPAPTSAVATSATLPMRTSEAPAPDAFQPPPPAPPAPTDPAMPVELMKPSVPPVVDAAAAAKANEAPSEAPKSVKAIEAPSEAPPSVSAPSARAKPSAPIPITWIVGGTSIALGAVGAVVVLFSGGDEGVEATPTSASVTASTPAPPRRPLATIKKRPAASAATAEASANASSVPMVEASAVPVVDDGTTSGASGGGSASAAPKTSAAPKASAVPSAKPTTTEPADTPPPPPVPAPSGS